MNSQARTVKQITGIHRQYGGEEHSGWLPPNAAKPRPTPVRSAVLDVRIEDDGSSFLLICESRNTPDSWDTWHESLEDAEEQARASLSIEPWEWEEPPPGPDSQ